MKKISFILFLLFFSIGKATTIKVGANFPVKKIKQALALAKDGDTVLVHSGIYKEGTILINKKIYF
ncbi:MAG: nitrous oxide reductase family maturation protein NosD, partial [Flavobacterium sp.]